MWDAHSYWSGVCEFESLLPNDVHPARQQVAAHTVESFLLSWETLIEFPALDIWRVDEKSGGLFLCLLHKMQTKQNENRKDNVQMQSKGWRTE